MFTENNLHTKRVRKAPFFTLLPFLVAFLFSGTVKGQKISKYYTSLLQESGTLYFILPTDEFIGSSSINTFTYDISYSSSKDSVNINFSYIHDETIKIDSIRLNNVTVPVKKIFIEPKKKNWHYRYSFSYPYNQLKTFYNQQPPAEIILYSSSAKIKIISRPKKWEKYAAIKKKIIQLIDLNK